MDDGKNARDVLRDLRTCCDDIVRRWYARMEGQPWMRLPGEVTLDHMPELIDATVAALLGEPDVETSRRRAVAFACKHGAHRREQGMDDAVLLREHHVLRAAIWDVMRERHGETREAFHAITLFDVATTKITSGSLHGFHLRENPDALVARLASEGPWPDPA